MKLTPRNIALGIGIALLIVALVMRAMGVARPILMALHAVSLAACGIGLLIRDPGGNSP
jgi:hypothetical protein